jgi:hypothetical protein
MKAETGLKEKWLERSSFFSSSPPFCEQDIHTPQQIPLLQQKWDTLFDNMLAFR